jgi:hypothetical protein
MDNKTQIQIAPHAQSKVIVMHGKAIPTIEAFYKDLQIALQIPNYFGHNLDALDEVLHDLSWISEKHLILILYRSGLLCVHHKEDRANLLSLLTSCTNPKIDILLL